jgi:hypothetical protein
MAEKETKKVVRVPPQWFIDLCKRYFPTVPNRLYGATINSRGEAV